MNNMSKGSILAIIVVLTIIMTGLIVNKHCKAQDKTGYDYGLWVGESRGYVLNDKSYSFGGRINNWGGELIFFSDAEKRLCNKKKNITSNCVLDRPIPPFLKHKINQHSKTKNTTGITIMRFFDIINNQSLHIGGGFYSIYACKIAKSNATWWEYCQENKNKSKLGLSVGYTVKIGHLLIGAQYSSFREMGILIGMAW